MFDAFQISHIFSCLSSDPLAHFYLQLVQVTEFTLSPWPKKECRCLPDCEWYMLTVLSVEPVSNRYPPQSSAMLMNRFQAELVEKDWATLELVRSQILMYLSPPQVASRLPLQLNDMSQISLWWCLTSLRNGFLSIQLLMSFYYFLGYLLLLGYIYSLDMGYLVILLLSFYFGLGVYLTFFEFYSNYYHCFLRQNYCAFIYFSFYNRLYYNQLRWFSRQASRPLSRMQLANTIWYSASLAWYFYNKIYFYYNKHSKYLLQLRDNSVFVVDCLFIVIVSQSQ